MAGNKATIGDILSKVPADVRKRWTVSRPLSYTPTMGEIESEFPMYRDKYGKPSTVFDGISVDGEYSPDEHVDSDDVHFRSTALSSLRCSASTIAGEMPISGGTLSVSCSATFAWMTDGNVDREDTFSVVPAIRCSTAECHGNEVAIPANLTTSAVSHDVECKYGYKGRMLSETIAVRQKPNGHNEWELESDADRHLVAECGRTDFGKEGGSTWYRVKLRRSEVWVRRDMIGNVVEREVRTVADEDVTESAIPHNQYSKRFVVGGGEIVCLPQRPNNTAVAFHVKFTLDRLETSVRLTQECGDKTTDECVFEFDGVSGDTVGIVDTDGSLETEVRLVSKVVEKIGEEVVSDRINRNIRIIGKPEWIDAVVTDDGESVSLYVRTLSGNRSRETERAVTMVLSNRECFSKPLKVSVTQPAVASEGIRIAASARYPREVLMEMCDGDEIRVDVAEVRSYTDGSTERRVADPNRYEVLIETDDFGSMLSASDAEYDPETGEYVSRLSFVSENMNDYFDFRVVVVDYTTGERVFVGRTESIHCREIPYREAVRDDIEKVHIVDTRKNKLSDIKEKKFVLRRDPDGTLRIARK